MQRINEVITGGCQCGAVRYRSETVLDNAHLCHCRMCQKAVGNIFAALVAAPNDALTWTRGEPAVFASSDQAERGFCRDCGTPLFYRSLSTGRTNLTIGSLDEPHRFKPLGHDGVESRVPWFAQITKIEDEAATEQEDNRTWVDAISRSNRQHPDHDTEKWPP